MHLAQVPSMQPGTFADKWLLGLSRVPPEAQGGQVTVSKPASKHAALFALPEGHQAAPGMQKYCLARRPSPGASRVWKPLSRPGGRRGGASLSEPMGDAARGGRAAGWRRSSANRDHLGVPGTRSGSQTPAWCGRRGLPSPVPAARTVSRAPEKSRSGGISGTESPSPEPEMPVPPGGGCLPGSSAPCPRVRASRGPGSDARSREPSPFPSCC